MSTVTGGNINFTNWKEAAELQLKFIEQLGKYKLNVAQAELTAAVAEGERAVAAARRAVIRELEAAMKRLTRSRRVILDQADDWARLGNQLSRVQNGSDIGRTAIVPMWTAFQVCLRTVSTENRGKIMDITLTATDRKGTNFADVRSEHASDTVTDVPSDLENILELIQWLRSKKWVMPKVGKRVWQKTCDAFDIMAQFGVGEIKRLNDLSASIEEKTYKTWQPIQLAAFLDNQSIKDILAAKPAS
jgi:hypothetical protein